jgi:hypothetical protein
MREPKRLLSHGATDFERQLLRAVVSERPSALLRSRMQRGLGLVGPLAWASNVKAMFGSAGSRFVAGVAVAGVVAAGGFAAYRLIPSTNAAADAAPAGELQAARELSSAPLPELQPPFPALQPPATIDDPPRAPPAVVAPSEASRPAAPDDDSQLREEIALLDAARAALQRSDREAARASLSSYRARFPEGILRREANVLRGRAESKADRAAATGN